MAFWVRLATLPAGAAEDGLARGPQAGMIVGDDVSDAAHAAGDEAHQEGAPMDLGLGERAGDAQDPAPFVRPDADSREHGGIAHDTAIADLLVARVEEQIADLTQGPIAPGFELLVQEPCGAADLARRQAGRTCS